MKRIIFLFSFLYLCILSFSFQIFYNSYETIAFLKQKILSSIKVELVSLTLDETLSEQLEKTENNIYLESSLLKLKNEKLNINKDKNSLGYLHEKFIVFDDRAVFFGTGNFTKNSLLDEFNVFIYSEDTQMVEVFREEIKNYKKRLYGKDKKFINNFIKSDDLGVVHFMNTPSQNIVNNITKKIRNSRKEIILFSYSLTDPVIVYELEKASSDNKTVKILSDDWNLVYNSPLKYMTGIEIRYNKKIHAKIILLDDNITIIGSYNLTYRARDKNDEFIVIIENKKLNKQLKDKFYEIYNDKINTKLEGFR